jgi:hypothetical protein
LTARGRAVMRLASRGEAGLWFVAGALTGEFFGEVFPYGLPDARGYTFIQVVVFEAILVFGREASIFVDAKELSSHA